MLHIFEGFISSLCLNNKMDKWFLLRSEGNQILPQAGNSLEVSIKRKYPPPFYQLSLKLLEIRASSGSADSKLTRAA